MLGSQTYIKTEREIELREFAKECGFRLRFYHEGLCAIFDKRAAEQGKPISNAQQRRNSSPRPRGRPKTFVLC